MEDSIKMFEHNSTAYSITHEIDLKIIIVSTSHSIYTFNDSEFKKKKFFCVHTLLSVEYFTQRP